MGAGLRWTRAPGALPWIRAPTALLFCGGSDGDALARLPVGPGHRPPEAPPGGGGLFPIPSQTALRHAPPPMDLPPLWCVLRPGPLPSDRRREAPLSGAPSLRCGCGVRGPRACVGRLGGWRNAGASGCCLPSTLIGREGLWRASLRAPLMYGHSVERLPFQAVSVRWLLPLTTCVTDAARPRLDGWRIRWIPVLSVRRARTGRGLVGGTASASASTSN